MRRFTMTVALLSLIVLSGFWTDTAQAGANVVDWTPFCFDANPFVDKLTLGLIDITGKSKVFAITALSWQAIDYRILGQGTLSLDYPGEAFFVLGPLQLYNPTSFFGDNPFCELNAHAAKELWNQHNGWSWDLKCTGGIFGDYAVAGTFTARPGCADSVHAQSTREDANPYGQAGGVPR